MKPMDPPMSREEFEMLHSVEEKGIVMQMALYSDKSIIESPAEWDDVRRWLVDSKIPIRVVDAFQREYENTEPSPELSGLPFRIRAKLSGHFALLWWDGHDIEQMKEVLALVSLMGHDRPVVLR